MVWGYWMISDIFVTGLTIARTKRLSERLVLTRYSLFYTPIVHLSQFRLFKLINRKNWSEWNDGVKSGNEIECALLLWRSFSFAVVIIVCRSYCYIRCN